MKLFGEEQPIKRGYNQKNSKREQRLATAEK